MDTKPCCAHSSPKVDLLHVKLDILCQQDLYDIAIKAISDGDKILLGHHNLHSLYLCKKSPVMAQFYQKADFIHIDGMSIVLLGKALGLKLNKQNRLTSLDWLLPLMDHCQQLMQDNLRVFLLGGQPGVAEIAGKAFKERVENVEVRTCHGFFDINDAKACDSIREMINQYRPHMLLVGMGMPRQEEWIVSNYDRIDADVVWSLGAFMDYYAGIIPVPPRWLGKIGLEWAFRLWSEPRRLWRRYLLEPWLIAWLLAKELLFKRALGGAANRKQDK